MKRDMDLIRELMLKLEAYDKPAGVTSIIDPYYGRFSVDGYSADQVQYHLNQIRMEGFVECPGSLPASGGITFRSITPSGHDFIDAVRDQETWSKTKKAASGAGGFTLDLLKDLAKGFIKKQIEDRTGIKM